MDEVIKVWGSNFESGTQRVSAAAIVGAEAPPGQAPVPPTETFKEVIVGRNLFCENVDRNRKYKCAEKPIRTQTLKCIPLIKFLGGAHGGMGDYLCEASSTLTASPINGYVVHGIPHISVGTNLLSLCLAGWYIDG